MHTVMDLQSRVMIDSDHDICLTNGLTATINRVMRHLKTAASMPFAKLHEARHAYLTGPESR